MYVADRENHRVQVFDGNGKYETQWNNLHRPCGLYCCRGKTPTFVIGELGPGLAVNLKAPNLGPRLSIVDAKGKLIARLGGKDGPGLEPGKFMAPHGLALDSKGDIYVGEVSYTNWKTSFPDTPHAQRHPLTAEAGEGDLKPIRLRPVVVYWRNSRVLRQQLPAVSLVAVPGRRRATLEVAREIERRGFPAIYTPSVFSNMSLCEALVPRHRAHRVRHLDRADLRAHGGRLRAELPPSCTRSPAGVSGSASASATRRRTCAWA